MWRTFALLTTAAFLLASVAGNVVLFRQAAENAASAQATRDRLTSSQEERAALEARVNELSAENQRLRLTPTPAAPVPSPTAGAIGVDRTILQRIEDQVARLRGLPRKGDVPVEFMSRSALRQYFISSLDRDYLPDERESDQKLRVTLGLLRPDEDLLQITLDLLEEQVLGFYDEDDKKMYLVDDHGGFGPEEKSTFAHELTHALQDQYYNLDQLRPKHAHNNDRYAAITAVAEGDAMLVERLWVQDNLTQEEVNRLNTTGGTSKLDQAPLVVRAELLFPYVNGFDFVRRAFQRTSSYAGIDDTFKKPPDSTEQILHPDKYWAGEQPVEVTLPDLAKRMGEGWRQIDANVLGELDLRILLEQYGDRAVASRAAAGWGGDRWELLEKDGRQALVLKTSWDTDNDAREFFDAYGQGLRSRFSGARQDEATDARQALTASTYATELRRQGRDVLAAIAFDRPTAEALAVAVGGF